MNSTSVMRKSSPETIMIRAKDIFRRALSHGCDSDSEGSPFDPGCAPDAIRRVSLRDEDIPQKSHQEQRAVDGFGRLPVRVLEQVLRKLEGPDLGAALLVNHRWHVAGLRLVRELKGRINESGLEAVEVLVGAMKMRAVNHKVQPADYLCHPFWRTARSRLRLMPSLAERPYMGPSELRVTKGPFFYHLSVCNSATGTVLARAGPVSRQTAWRVWAEMVERTRGDHVVTWKQVTPKQLRTVIESERRGLKASRDGRGRRMTLDLQGEDSTDSEHTELV